MKIQRASMAAVICLICAVLISSVTGSADKITKSDVVIDEYDYEYVWLFGLGKDDKFEVSVTVNSPEGGLVDVYILSSDEFSHYPYGSFSPFRAREKINSVEFSFTVPDDQTYYLVIDNYDNSRPNDAQPVGDVTVDYEYTDPLHAIEEAVEAFAWTCIAGIIIGIIVVVLIIVAILYLVFKKEKPSGYPAPYQPPPPPDYQAYQQYPQQQYQDPYQPPQQPPGQQPPY